MADTTTDFRRYLRLARKLQNGETVTKDEVKFIIGFKQGVDTGALDKIKDKAEFKKLTPEEQSELTTEALDASTKLLFQSPNYKETLISLAQDAEQGKLSEEITSGLNLALAGTDIITSINQINQGNKAARRSRRPTRPAPLTASPELANAISEAQNGNYDAIRALAPAQLANLDNYLSDLNVAKTASTGQAGAYGALAQVASNRRNRGNLELAPIYDSISTRNQQRLDELLRMKLNENQAIHQSQSQFYPTDVAQYQLEQQTAGQVGAQGRANLRSSLAGFAQEIPNRVAEMSTRKRYNNIYNTMSQYGEDIADMAGKTSLDVASRHNGTAWHPEWLQQEQFN